MSLGPLPQVIRLARFMQSSTAALANPPAGRQMQVASKKNAKAQVSQIEISEAVLDRTAAAIVHGRQECCWFHSAGQSRRVRISIRRALGCRPGLRIPVAQGARRWCRWRHTTRRYSGSHGSRSAVCPAHGEWRPDRSRARQPACTDDVLHAFFDVRSESLGDGEDLLSPRCRQDEFGSPIRRVGHTCDVVMSLEVTHEFRHRLLGHLRSLCQLADPRSGVVEVLKHRAVRRAHIAVPALRELHQDEEDGGHERLPHEDGDVGRALTTGEGRNAC